MDGAYKGVAGLSFDHTSHRANSVWYQRLSKTWLKVNYYRAWLDISNPSFFYGLIGPLAIYQIKSFQKMSSAWGLTNLTKIKSELEALFKIRLKVIKS